MKYNEIIYEVDTSKLTSQFLALVESVYVEKPKQSDLRKLKKFLEENPGLWRVVFDITEMIQKNTIKRMVDHKAMQISLDANISEMRQSLGYLNSSTLEQLLIENIISTWLNYKWADYQMVTFMGKAGVRFKEIEFWERRLSMSQRRYLQACESLVKVRRLMARTPTVQVNIAGKGGQQVNVAGDVIKK